MIVVARLIGSGLWEVIYTDRAEAEPLAPPVRPCKPPALESPPRSWLIPAVPEASNQVIGTVSSLDGGGNQGVVLTGCRCGRWNRTSLPPSTPDAHPSTGLA